MDKHDKHNKPGKSRKGGTPAPAKPEVAAAVPVEKAKSDWPGKPGGTGKKTR